MAQDILAPPKLKPRTFAVIVGASSALPVVGGIALGVTGFWTPWQLAWRLGLVVVLGGAAVFGYARLLRYSQTVRPERMPYVHLSVALISFSVFVGAMTAMLQDTGVGGGLGYLFMLPVIGGGTLIQGGWGRRVGESRHCPSCEYEFAFADAEAPIRCPECATPWLGRLKKGRKVKSVRMMATGLTVAIVGLFVLQPMFWVTPLAKVLPTPILFAALYVEPRSFGEPWDELAGRPLGQDWVNVMASRVLSHRRRHQWGSAGDRWFEKMVTAGKLSSEIIDRSRREAFKARLVAPARVRVGRPFDVGLRITRSTQGFGETLGVMFAGYSLDGGEPVGIQKEAAWAYQLRPGVFSGRRDAFRQELAVTTPGEHKITATYWVIIQPSFWTIDWGSDGSPVRPAGAVYFERVQVECTVLAR